MSKEIETINNEFGKHLFKGDVAAPYLERHGLARDVLNNSEWTKNGQASQVAAAVLDWSRDHGASTFCHWFQPLGSGGLRHGNSAGVQNRMFKFDRNGSLVWDFSANDLLYGETDGSSYPNGGLRATHRAGGYVVIDPTSPIFLRGDTIFIPSCFVSYNGHCLDEKTPLLRSVEAMSREAVGLRREVFGVQHWFGARVLLRSSSSLSSKTRSSTCRSNSSWSPSSSRTRNL